MAVWRFAQPQQSEHVWAIWDEPRAGPRTGTQDSGGGSTSFAASGRKSTSRVDADEPDVDFDKYPRHKLMLAFQESPDARLVCIHPVEKISMSRTDSHDGVVLIRRLETGDDMAELLHEGAKQKIPLVALAFPRFMYQSL